MIDRTKKVLEKEREELVKLQKTAEIALDLIEAQVREIDKKIDELSNWNDGNDDFEYDVN